MWRNKELKREARLILRRRYWYSVIVCLIMAFFVGVYTHPFSGGPKPNLTAQETLATVVDTSNSQILHRFFQEIFNLSPPVIEPVQGPRGLLAPIFNNITKSGSFLFWILNSVNQFVFGERIFSGILLLIGSALSFLFWLLVGNLLRVGENRFFLEARVYENTQIHRIFFLYRERKIRNPAWIMLQRAVRILLWSLTLVGGVIKTYEYRMVPYLVAENPDIPAKQAFLLSRNMMRGQKWRVFLLDCSFLHWYILSALTFGIFGFFYLNPYTALTNANLYVALRETALSGGTALAADPHLMAKPDRFPEEWDRGQYPVGPLYLLPSGKKWLSMNYDRSYTPLTVAMLFFSYCCIGWTWEVLYTLFGAGVLINPGVLHGPWLPIYGTGGILSLLLLKRCNRKPVLVFGLSVLLCGVIEYVTGWYLDVIVGIKWWDYTGYLLNINTYVCLEALLVFGLGGFASVYFLAPLLGSLIDRIPKKVRVALVAVLAAVFLADVLYSAHSPNLLENVIMSVGRFFAPAA